MAPVLSDPGVTRGSRHERPYRRRRAMAGVALIAVVALIVILERGSGLDSAHIPAAGRLHAGASPSRFARALEGRIAGRELVGGATSPAQARAIDRVLGYTSYVSLGSGRHRDVALTFDDGPGPFTPQVLGILRRERVPATFFQVGRSISAYRALGRQEARDGYVIGDHTNTHALLARLPLAEQSTEIGGTANAIRDYGGPYPRLFRPPFGSLNANTSAVTRADHMLMVLWSVDTRDFSQPGTDRIVYTALSGAKPGAIILMHDAGGPRAQTVAALPRIIRGLRRRHFHLVTVPKLILDDPPRRSQSPPRSLSGL